jgi:hypothetical protein
MMRRVIYETRSGGILNKKKGLLFGKFEINFQNKFRSTTPKSLNFSHPPSCPEDKLPTFGNVGGPATTKA